MNSKDYAKVEQEIREIRQRGGYASWEDHREEDALAVLATALAKVETELGSQLAYEIKEYLNAKITEREGIRKAFLLERRQAEQS